MPDRFSCIIVDDEPDAIELLQRRIMHLYKNIHVVATYPGWAQALEALKEVSCDLLMMDISMPGKNGIDMLHLLPGLDCEIIFVTAYEQYAIDAFAFSTSGYILKPINDQALATAIDKAIGRIETKRLARQSKVIPAVNKLGIPSANGIDYVDTNEVMYLLADGNYTYLHTPNKVFTASKNLKDFEDLLPPDMFCRIHYGHIVNIHFILKVQKGRGGVVHMKDGKQLEVAVRRKEEFMKLFAH